MLKLALTNALILVSVRSQGTHIESAAIMTLIAVMNGLNGIQIHLPVILPALTNALILVRRNVLTLLTLKPVAIMTLTAALNGHLLKAVEAARFVRMELVLLKK